MPPKTKIYSWEDMSLKTLRVLYAINGIFILGTVTVLIVIICSKGFKPKMLFLLGGIPSFLMYGRQMKRVIDQKKEVLRKEEKKH